MVKLSKRNLKNEGNSLLFTLNRLFFNSFITKEKMQSKYLNK